eukprot:TRINITY_DN103886_c0_g1_i1.p1 TRINITY_DN103886_c0_g1~~TRINITY_DN103886_c0_g1_i1.p1  ORF type:complete len:732 (+),score=156.67 TRINITY_DN103886_c0_g1_i1:66-2261(+)
MTTGELAMYEMQPYGVGHAMAMAGLEEWLAQEAAEWLTGMQDPPKTSTWKAHQEKMRREWEQQQLEQREREKEQALRDAWSREVEAEQARKDNQVQQLLEHQKQLQEQLKKLQEDEYTRAKEVERLQSESKRMRDQAAKDHQMEKERIQAEYERKLEAERADKLQTNAQVLEQETAIREQLQAELDAERKSKMDEIDAARKDAEQLAQEVQEKAEAERKEATQLLEEERVQLNQYVVVEQQKALGAQQELSDKHDKLYRSNLEMLQDCQQLEDQLNKEREHKAELEQRLREMEMNNRRTALGETEKIQQESADRLKKLEYDLKVEKASIKDLQTRLNNETMKRIQTEEEKRKAIDRELQAKAAVEELRSALETNMHQEIEKAKRELEAKERMKDKEREDEEEQLKRAEAYYKAHLERLEKEKQEAEDKLRAETDHATRQRIAREVESRRAKEEAETRRRLEASTKLLNDQLAQTEAKLRHERKQADARKYTQERHLRELDKRMAEQNITQREMEALLKQQKDAEWRRWEWESYMMHQHRVVEENLSQKQQQLVHQQRQWERASRERDREAAEWRAWYEQQQQQLQHITHNQHITTHHHHNHNHTYITNNVNKITDWKYFQQIIVPLGRLVHLKKSFEESDLDHTGRMDLYQLGRWVKKHGLLHVTHDQLIAMVALVDANHNAEVDFWEFLAIQLFLSLGLIHTVDFGAFAGYIVQQWNPNHMKTAPYRLLV